MSEDRLDKNLSKICALATPEQRFLILNIQKCLHHYGFKFSDMTLPDSVLGEVMCYPHLTYLQDAIVELYNTGIMELIKNLDQETVYFLNVDYSLEFTQIEEWVNNDDN